MRAPFFALLLIAGFASGAFAQPRLSFAGGPSYPLGALADNFDDGWHAQLSAGLSVPLLPVALRVDAAFHRFARSGEDFQIIAGSVNGLIRLPSILLVPYVIGGVGAYSSNVTNATDIDEETTNFGANIGAGLSLSLPGLSLFAEARVHNVFADGRDVRFAPVSIGMTF